MAERYSKVRLHAKRCRGDCRITWRHVRRLQRRTSASTTRLLQMPDTPPRLDIIFQKYDPPLFFVTFNTHHRRRLLANAQVNNELVTFAKSGEQRAIAVGRYVIMPDPLHIFVSGHQDFLLTQWVRLLKRALSKVISQSRPHWQKGFFDHPIRHRESYSEKWEYVRQNPVRAGLVGTPKDWPWQGEIVPIDQQSVDREPL
jgi:putative transposase